MDSENVKCARCKEDLDLLTCKTNLEGSVVHMSESTCIDFLLQRLEQSYIDKDMIALQLETLREDNIILQRRLEKIK